MNLEDIFINIGISLIGGIIGGGGLQAWIEWQRHKREKKTWDRNDKKIEIISVSSDEEYYRWDLGYLDDDEKLRIYETGLLGNAKEWKYLTKFTITNTTDEEVLIISTEFETSQLEMKESSCTKKEYFRPPKQPYKVTYNLQTKEIIRDIDFPLGIPAHSTVGFVFLGVLMFDAPLIVKNPPKTATLKIVLNDGTLHEKETTFTNAKPYSLPCYFTEIDDVLHWEDYLIKHDISFSYVPF